jgi:hypothetical protein
MRRLTTRVPLALGAVLLAVAGCGDDDAGSVADGSTTTAESTTTTPGGDGGAGATTETTEAQGTVIEIFFADGEVEGGGRHRVALGDQVTLRVTSDVADHVHLHGYDVLVDVAAGEPAELTFEATIPGVFEAELEDSRIPLVELEIS